MEHKNPFLDLDHIEEEPEGLKERVMRSAADRKAWLTMAKMFTGDYLGTIFRLSGGKRGDTASDPNDD
jgi:hypothetical protein